MLEEFARVEGHCVGSVTEESVAEDLRAWPGNARERWVEGKGAKRDV